MRRPDISYIRSIIFKFPQSYIYFSLERKKITKFFSLQRKVTLIRLIHRTLQRHKLIFQPSRLSRSSRETAVQSKPPIERWCGECQQKTCSAGTWIPHSRVHRPPGDVPGSRITQYNNRVLGHGLNMTMHRDVAVVPGYFDPVSLRPLLTVPIPRIVGMAAFFPFKSDISPIFSLLKGKKSLSLQKSNFYDRPYTT